MHYCNHFPQIELNCSTESDKTRTEDDGENARGKRGAQAGACAEHSAPTLMLTREKRDGTTGIGGCVANFCAAALRGATCPREEGEISNLSSISDIVLHLLACVNGIMKMNQSATDRAATTTTSLASRCKKREELLHFVRHARC